MSKTKQGASSSQQNSGNSNQSNQGKPQSYGTVPLQRGAGQSNKKIKYS
ncbi:MAG: hypothetical protein HY754_03825 [Nitrospirae bacterium]|nr:hypothetical protein [Nitrospirota bacterium]